MKSLLHSAPPPHYKLASTISSHRFSPVLPPPPSPSSAAIPKISLSLRPKGLRKSIKFRSSASLWNMCGGWGGTCVGSFGSGSGGGGGERMSGSRGCSDCFRSSSAKACLLERINATFSGSASFLSSRYAESLSAVLQQVRSS